MLPTIDIPATCMRIKELCEEKGYSAVRLQESLGLESVQAVYKWFKGKNLPNIDNLVAIMYLMEVSFEDLVVLAEDRVDDIQDQREP